MTHEVLAVTLGPGVCASVMVDAVEPTGGADGTKQAAWHVAAWNCRSSCKSSWPRIAPSGFRAGGDFRRKSRHRQHCEQNGQAAHDCLYRSSVALDTIAR